MNIKVKGALVSGIVEAIPSKSYVHRISICNFLAGKTEFCNCGEFFSNDVTATINCLSALRRGETRLDAGESGSTLRFLLPLLSAIGGEYQITGHGKLMERPNQELFSALNQHGVKAEQTDCIKISGKLTSGEFYLRGDISSQYVSGLLMALPTLDGDSKIILTTSLVSEPYVDITLQVLKAYGIEITRFENGFNVKGNQKYRGELLPEGDWSNSAFFLVLGAIAGKISVQGLNLNSVQGDKKIMDVLKSAGAKISLNDGLITTEKSALNGFTLDAENCPDLVPISAVLASFASGKTVIKNVSRLKIKESDRIESTIKMLDAFNVKAEYVDGDMVVYGGKTIAGEIDSFNDHRITMSSAVMATATDCESILYRADAVNKSYPEFFVHLTKVGGIVNEF